MPDRAPSVAIRKTVIRISGSSVQSRIVVRAIGLVTRMR
jgi:hypothetical protein